MSRDTEGKTLADAKQRDRERDRETKSPGRERTERDRDRDSDSDRGDRERDRDREHKRDRRGSRDKRSDSEREDKGLQRKDSKEKDRDRERDRDRDRERTPQQTQGKRARSGSGGKGKRERDALVSVVRDGSKADRDRQARDRSRDLREGQEAKARRESGEYKDRETLSSSVGSQTGALSVTDSPFASPTLTASNSYTFGSPVSLCLSPPMSSSLSASQSQTHTSASVKLPTGGEATFPRGLLLSVVMWDFVFVGFALMLVCLICLRFCVVELFRYIIHDNAFWFCCYSFLSVLEFRMRRTRFSRCLCAITN